MTSSVTRQRVSSENWLEYASKCRDEGHFNDVTLVAGNEAIPANRLVLSFQSKFFERMFMQPRLKKYNDIVEIRTIDGSSMRALIDFMYRGCIQINDENVLSFLKAANALQLHDVEQFCFDFFHSSIGPKNSLDILNVATLYRNDALKDEIQQFINANLDKVAQTDSFKKLSKKDLISLISNLDRVQVKENSIYRAVVTWAGDQKSRLGEFPDVFRMVKLDKISLEFMEKDILQEELVVNNLNCLTVALKSFFNHIKADSAEFLKTQLVSMGGYATRKDVRVVFCLPQEIPQKIPNFEKGLCFHCSLKLDDYVYALGGQLEEHGLKAPTNEIVKINLINKKQKWEKVALLNEKRSAMGATVFCGTLFVAGGENEKHNETASAEFYNPTYDKWKYASPLHQRRVSHTLVSCDGYLFAIGGWSDDKCLSSGERLQNLEDTWQYIQPMQTPRSSFAAVSLEGTVYAIGGQFRKDPITALKTVEKYDPAANQWSYVADMQITRQAHAACVLLGKIYVVGGIEKDGKVVKEIECYDPSLDRWSIVGKITEDLWHHTLVAV